MKIKENVTVYTCDFCKKKMFRKSAMEKHEHECYRNPENEVACNGCCAHLIKKEASVYLGDNYFGVETHINCELFYCTAKNVFLYPMKTHFKGNAFHQEQIDDGTKPNELMPKECQHFELPF